jgi:hypothetical protein
LTCSHESSTGPYHESDDFQSMPPPSYSVRSILVWSSNQVYVFLVVSFLLAFPPKSVCNPGASPILLHALSISTSLTWSFQLYLANTANYKTPHYAIAPTSHYFNPFRSKYSPQHPFLKHQPSLFIPKYQRQSFASTCNYMENYNSVYSTCYVFRQQRRRRSILKEMVARITLGFALNFHMNQILIYYCSPHKSELCYIIEES